MKAALAGFIANSSDTTLRGSRGSYPAARHRRTALRDFLDKRCSGEYILKKLWLRVERRTQEVHNSRQRRNSVATVRVFKRLGTACLAVMVMTAFLSTSAFAQAQTKTAAEETGKSVPAAGPAGGGTAAAAGAAGGGGTAGVSTPVLAIIGIIALGGLVAVGAGGGGGGGGGSGPSTTATH
jgi:hypothetical protein